MTAATNKDLRIVIGHRGWVWIGYWSQDGDEISLAKARTIRRWGTPGEGLERLTRGPAEQTEYSSEGATYRMHRLAVISSLDCKPEGLNLWGKILNDSK